MSNENAWCHLCNCITTEEFYIDHLSNHHPTLLFVLYATHLPLNQTRYVNNFPFYMNQILYDDDIEHLINDDSDYETLLAICNEIGDHKVGISNVRDLSIVISNKAGYMADDKCPICLDAFNANSTDIYLLKVCNHAYCKECIETWCIENKSCPVCKIDIA